MPTERRERIWKALMGARRNAELAKRHWHDDDLRRVYSVLGDLKGYVVHARENVAQELKERGEHPEADADA